jgi:hypothetical protein
MSIPYMIGRRTTVKTPVTSQHGRDTTSNLRAEDSGTTALRTLGWSVATFGAGAVLGWVATRKSSARGPEDDAS